MRVFCAFVAGGMRREKEGCRRGINGRGGAGARGYLVRRRALVGPVGDFMVATVRGGSVLSPAACSSARFCFRRRSSS